MMLLEQTIFSHVMTYDIQTHATHGMSIKMKLSIIYVSSASDLSLISIFSETTLPLAVSALSTLLSIISISIMPFLYYNVLQAVGEFGPWQGPRLAILWLFMINCGCHIGAKVYMSQLPTMGNEMTILLKS